MRKSIFISLFVFTFFLLEFLLFNLIGKWFVPNLLLLLVIFFDLYFGIRYGILTAVLAGLLKDSFSTSMFGLYLFSFVLCAYLTNIIKRYIYFRGSTQRRLLLVLIISLINFFIQYCLHFVTVVFNVFEVFRFIFLPEVVITLLITPFIFDQLKKCASKLFV